jgi:peptidyl-prolyl cis-trans isomerase SurA
MTLVALLSAGSGEAEVINRIVATVDGEPITLHQLRGYIADRRMEQAPQEQALQTLVTDKLLEREASTLGIAARDEDIDRYIEGVKQRGQLDDARFTQALAEQGMTPEQYRVRVKAEIEKMQLVNREIRQRVNVSPEEVERHYQENRERYKTVAGVSVRDIFFALPAGADAATDAAVRARAEEVRRLAQEGRDFGELAREFSQGPGADKGGLLGTFAPGQMEPALDRAAFALAPGDVSEPVRTAKGYHLLRVEGTAGKGEQPLDRVREEIRETLYNEALQSRFDDWLSKDLRERHHVEVLD